MSESKHSPIRLESKVIIRTVTMYYTGRIVELTKDEIVLSDAAWIADSGRWHQALEKGELAEVEPYPGVVSVARGAVVDVSPWNHELPRKAK